jgi:hypothetical protein
MSDMIPAVPGETRILKNGAVFDVEKNHITKGAVLDKAQASAMARIRWDKARRAWASGMADVARSPISAIREIAKAQTILAKSGQGRASTEAAKLVLRVGDYVPDVVQTSDNGQSGLRLDNEGVSKLLDVLAQVITTRQDTR